MSLIVHPSLLQGTDEWLEQRRGMVTASVVGQLLTTKSKTGIDYGCMECFVDAGNPCVSKKKGDAPATPIKTLHAARTEAARDDNAPPELVPAANDYSRSLTAQLVAERITGWVDPVYVTDAMLRGQEDEPRAVAAYSEHYAEVTTIGFMIRREDDWTLGYSPDGLVGDDGLIEVKSRAAKKQVTTILEDAVPPENMAQCQAGLLVSGREWLDYVSICCGMPLYRKRVYPDQRWFDAITAAVKHFEETAAVMIAKYEMLTQEMPLTERVVEQEMFL